ncbi:MAG: EamA family transporter, partial [Spirochaetales bacterium]
SLIMSIRFALAALIMGLLSFKDFKQLDKKTLFHGSIAGLFLFFAFYVQTLGQKYTSVSNAAFLTATNVVMIPFIVWAISKKRPLVKTFILATTTLLGIAVLTLKIGQNISFNAGDLLILLCALLFALHIAYLGIFSAGLNAKLLTFMQLAVAAIFSLGILFIVDFSSITAEVLQKGIFPSVYLALFSTCLCYFMQTKAQQYIAPGKAGIILCMEGLFGSIFSVVLGLDILTMNLVVGGLIIITSVMLSEANIGFKKKEHI